MALILKEFACKRNSIYKFQNFAMEKNVKGRGFQWKYLRYQAAVAAIEQYGWQAIHGDAQAQICTFLSKKLWEDHEMTIHLIKCHITGMGGGEHHGFYWGITFWITIHLLIPPKNIRCSFWGVDSTPLVCCGREPRSMSSTTDSLGESSSSRSSRWVLWGDVGGWQWSCCRNWRKWLVRQWDLQESPPWIMRLKQEMQRSQIRPCCFWWMQSHFVDGRNWRVL